MSDTLLLHVHAMQRNPWYARMYMNVIAAAATGANIPYDTVHYDPSGSLTTGAGAKYTVPVDGYYLMTGAFRVSGAGVNAYGNLRKNNVIMSQSTYYNAAVATQSYIAQDIIKCVAGDTLAFTLGLACSVDTGIHQSYFEVMFLAPS